ncbi:MAG: beta-ketoacyl-ACP synthase II [Bacteroidales bacterium]|jgi:3-oxoacyl-[acyl-carrier-protein] synthase II|nr:beta-ketoacyl-ACP synthase II [Bacteroidales bacterium]
MELRRVVITGLGALTPIGNSCDEYWKNLLLGVSGAGPISRFDATLFKTRFACEVKNFDILKYVDIKESRKMDLFTQFAISVAYEAMEDAKIDLSKADLERAGVIWGTGIGGFTTCVEEMNTFAHGDGTPRYSPFFIPKIIADIAAGQISMIFGLKGPNYVTTSACASAANAIADAFNIIRLGKADFVITGGSEAPINSAGVGGFNSMQAMSTRNDSPATASRPFDKDRNGFVIGEGAGALVVEELEHAIKRGAKIYAEIGGCGLSSDAYHITAPQPEGKGAFLAMKNTLKEAELPIEAIDHINTHGTSTPLGDIAEVKAIQALFGEHAYNININSIKSMIGHLLGAAGAVESIATVLTVFHDIVPPTINHFEDDENIDNKLNFTFNKAQKRIVNVAMSNAFGFGGHNTSLLFKKYKE